MIPRLFHQIWLGPDPIPVEYEGYRVTWQRHHPGWETKLWTEENIPSDLERRETYDRLRRPAERSDLLRIELLYREGGVYVDLDFECLRSIEPLLEGVELFCAYIDPGRVNNAIVGSIPGHPLLERGIRELRPREDYGPVDKEGTGPLFLNRLVAGDPGVTIFDEGLFYPRTPAAVEAAYAIHHAGRSWKEPADLVKDAARAEQRLAIAQDELEVVVKERDLALAEIEALRGRKAVRAMAFRLGRTAVPRRTVARVRRRLRRADPPVQ